MEAAGCLSFSLSPYMVVQLKITFKNCFLFVDFRETGKERERKEETERETHTYTETEREIHPVNSFTFPFPASL